MEPSDLLGLILDSDELCRDYAQLFLTHELTTPEVLSELSLAHLTSIGITNRHHALHILQSRDKVLGLTTAQREVREVREEEEADEEPITVSMLCRCSPNSQKKYAKVAVSELSTLTHLVLSEKGITKISNLDYCPMAQTLFLYDNRISTIENLSPVTRLKILYLQGNRIRKLQGLRELVQLQRLDISDNEIQVLEGLEELQQLQELACNRQRISSPLLLDETSLVGISKTLLKLSLANNSLEDVSSLWYLDAVQEVDLSGNGIEFTEAVDKMLTCMRSLRKLNMKDTPFARIPKYRDEVVMRNATVLELDGRDILANEREYLYRLKTHKKAPKENIVLKTEAPKKHQPMPVRFKGAGKPKPKTEPPVLEVTGRKQVFQIP